jgi:hypothetical protein
VPYLGPILSLADPDLAAYRGYLKWQRLNRAIIPARDPGFALIAFNRCDPEMASPHGDVQAAFRGVRVGYFDLHAVGGFSAVGGLWHFCGFHLVPPVYLVVFTYAWRILCSELLVSILLLPSPSPLLSRIYLIRLADCRHSSTSV